MSLPAAATLLPRPSRPSGPRSAFDVNRVRADFPILKQTVHGKPLIYFDNGATTQKPQAVLDAISEYYESQNANVHRGAHRLSELATEAYEAARIKAQKFLGAHCLREIIFTRGTTEAINLVAHSYGRSHVQAGDEILITWMEHHSNIVPWQLLCQDRGAHLRVVPITDTGELRLDELEKLLTPRTKMLALVHVSNALGTINPIRKVIELAHSRGVPVLVDGAQAVPHLRVDVQDLDCDFYAFSGHKIYGPTGIGVLYGKARYLELMPPYQGGGDMIRSVSFEKTTYNELPYKFEAGTPNIAAAIGLGAALDYVDNIGLEAIAVHEQELVRYATQCLGDISGVRIIGTAQEKAAAISFVVEDPPLSALDVGTRLDLEGIAVRTGHHCCMPLMDRFGIPGTARASFAVYNTLEEVEIFARALNTIVAEASDRGKPVALPSHEEATYPPASAASPEQAAEQLIELFDFLEDWQDRYRQIIEMGEQLLPMPAAMKNENTRVRGCQSTVYIYARRRPGTSNILEFLADSDAEIVRGLVALLQKVYSGQPADQILAFDVQTFMGRLGLDKNLSMGRRNGLGEMVQRIRRFAGEIARTT
jgi:cysteine desulfurase / selenocysteine lyase